MKILSIFSLRIDRFFFRGYYDKVCCNYLKLYIWVVLDIIIIVCKYYYYLYVNFLLFLVKILSLIISDFFFCFSLVLVLLFFCGFVFFSGNI